MFFSFSSEESEGEEIRLVDLLDNDSKYENTSLILGPELI